MMRTDRLACPDPIADRRFAYGQAAAKDGDWAAAADLFEQTLELVPLWAPAHFALGEARHRLGESDAASAAFRAALAADPSDSQGAAARLALIEDAPAICLPPAYVARLFDDYAPHFNDHLTKTLAYRGPALLIAALDETALGRRFAHALDLGCGAGLMGEAVRSRAERLTGVDLSPAMVAQARRRGVYEALVVGQALAFLKAAGRGVFGLVLAADVLCYIGDLAPLFEAASRAMAPDGLFAFTAERFGGEGYRLQETMRFAHSPAHIESAARAAGLAPVLLRPASTRRDAGADVPGVVAVFTRAPTG